MIGQSGQNIRRDVEVVLRLIDQRDIGVFEIFHGSVVDNRRRIGEAGRDRDERNGKT
jgi:hypothetical protein